jgi:hypothetical protein
MVFGAWLVACIRICSITMNGVNRSFGRRAAFSVAFHALTITAVVKQPHVGNWCLDPRSPNSDRDCALRAVAENAKRARSRLRNVPETPEDDFQVTGHADP